MRATDRWIRLKKDKKLEESQASSLFSYREQEKDKHEAGPHVRKYDDDVDGYRL